MVKAVVGANWGDEGKGKITDMLAQNCHIVVRFQGGSNAGHTIVNQYGKFALHMLPSGVFNENTVNVLGNGVALNIPFFIKEVEELRNKSVLMGDIIVSDRAQVLMPYHILFDTYEEERLKEGSFGSTKSGIAPLYSDKYAKIGFQVNELFQSEEYLRNKIKNIVALKNPLLKELYKKPLLDEDEIYKTILEYADLIENYVADTSQFLREAIREGQEILLEGQLGSLKDTDHGIYPMVTSSSTLSGYASIGAGIPARSITDVITVVKAYSSSVGGGEFVSELFGEEASLLRENGGDGGEYGATTGRPRRVGWFDCVASKYGCLMQGTTEVALTIVDALGYLDEIPVCVAYEIGSLITTEFPTPNILKCAKPVYKVLPGWKTNIRDIKKYEDLPENCRNYIEFIEDQIEHKITLISNGPSRDNIILR